MRLRRWLVVDVPDLSVFNSFDEGIRAEIAERLPERRVKSFFTAHGAMGWVERMNAALEKSPYPSTRWGYEVRRDG